MRAIFLLACVSALSAVAQGSPRAAAKRVWTNEDLEALRGKAPVSVLGRPPPPATNKLVESNASARAQRQREENATRYRRQLQPLYAELPRIDAEIAEMRRFQSGSYRMTGVWPLRFAGMPLNPGDRIAQLTTREREVRARISDLEDEARHAGILSGELR